MRNFLFFVIIALVFGACKKNRTCNCTVTKSGMITRTSESTGINIPAIPGLPPLPLIPGTSTTTTENYSIVTTYISNYDKVTKKQINSICPAKTEEMIYDRDVVSAVGLYTSTVVDSGTKLTECRID